MRSDENTLKTIETGVTNDELLAIASPAIRKVVKRFATRDERAEVAMSINPETAAVFYQTRGIDPYAEWTQEGDVFSKCWFAVDPKEGVAVALEDIDMDGMMALDPQLQFGDWLGNVHWLRAHKDQ